MLAGISISSNDSLSETVCVKKDILREDIDLTARLLGLYRASTLTFCITITASMTYAPDESLFQPAYFFAGYFELLHDKYTNAGFSRENSPLRINNRSCCGF